MNSPFDRVMDHLRRRGVTPLPPELKPDLETLVRRERIAKRLGHDVGLSPYLISLMRLEGRYL